MAMSAVGIAARFGALDSAAFAANEALSAHLLKAAGDISNWLIFKNVHSFTVLWDASTDGGTDTETGMLAGWAEPFWSRACMIPIIKPHSYNRVDLRIWMKVTSTAQVLVQVQTTHPEAPFRDDADQSDGTNTVLVTGTGAFQKVSIDNVPINPRNKELISIYVKSGPDGTLGNTGTNGRPHTGRVDSIIGRRAIVDARDATSLPTPNVNDWNTSLDAFLGPSVEAWNTTGHAVTIEEGTKVVMAPRKIILVGPYFRSTDGTLTGLIEFTPELESEDEAQLLVGRKFKILKLPDWRFASVTGRIYAI